jgi:hypothetical protein
MRGHAKLPSVTLRRGWRKLTAWRKKPAASPPAKPHLTSSQQTDLPLADITRDRLGRRAFSEHVAAVLANRPNAESLVVGLYGPWGDGKSTVLNFVETQLNLSADGPAVVRFNPWFYSSEQQIMDGFFKDLAEAVGRRIDRPGEEFGKKLAKVGQVSETLGGSFGGIGTGGRFVSNLARMLTSVSLKDRKDRLAAVLEDPEFRNNPLRVVVLIDDIDRLEREQIQLVFRMVKLAADLPYISYVLAFDEVVVGKSLAAQYGDDKSGMDFLEKIVQVPLKLPTIDSALLARLLLEEVIGVLAENDVQTDVSELYRLQTVLDANVLPQLRTLRTVKRFVSAVRFAIPFLPHEINVVDQVLIEGLRLLYGPAYDVVRRNKWRLVRLPASEQDRELLVESVRGAVQLLRPEMGDGCVGLLRELFPALQAAYGGRSFTAEDSLRWTSERRVCSEFYFNRYFSYGLPVGDILDRDIDEVLETAASDRDSGVAALRSTLGDNDDPGLVIEKLVQRAHLLPSLTARPLLYCVAAVGDDLPDHDSRNLTGVASRAGFLVQLLVGRLAPEEREHAVSEMVAVAGDSFAVLALGWLESASSDELQQPLLTGDELRSTGAALASRLLSHDGAEPLLKQHPRTGLLMYVVCRRFGDSERLARQLSAALIEDVELLRRLLGSYLPDFEGLPFGSLIARRGYEHLVWLMSAQEFMMVIRHHYQNLDELVNLLQSLPPDAPQSVALRSSTAAPMLQFAVLYQRSASALPGLPTAFEPGVANPSPLQTQDARAMVNSGPPGEPDLLLRVAVVVPNLPSGLAPSNTLATLKAGSEREKILMELLSSSQLSSWVTQRLGPPAVGELNWLVSGTNQGDVSTLKLGSEMWTSGARPAVLVESRFSTGYARGSSVGEGSAMTGLTLTSDIRFRFDESQLLSIIEFIDVITASLDTIAVARRAAQMLLPTGDFSTGQVAVVGATPKNDFGLVVDMHEWPTIPGNSPANDLLLYATLPLQTASGLTGDSLPAARQLFAIHCVRQIAAGTHHRDYEASLSAILRKLSALG